MSDQMTVRIVGVDAGASATAEKVGRGFRDLGHESVLLNRALDAIERNTAESARALDVLAREATQAERAIEKTEKTSDKFSKTGAALGATVSALTGFLADASRAAAESEASQARLEAAVNATGESYEQYADQLDAAGQAALEMSFDDEDAADALATLTTQTGSAQEALDLLGLAMDVARGRGISLAEASTLVGKVAEGNTAILQRYGIVLQEGATAQDALNALQTRYAGQAEAYAETTAGAIDRLQNSFENMLESVGASTGGLQTFLALLPGISAGLTGVSAILGALAGEAGIAALLTSLAGPAGLVVAAGAAAYAIYSLTRAEEDNTVTVLDAATATDGLTQALLRLVHAGAGVGAQIAAGQRWDAELDALARVSTQYENVTALEQAFVTTARDRAREEGLSGLETVQAINAARERARQVVDDYNLSLEESVEINRLLGEALNYTGVEFAAVSAYYDEAFADFERGRIDIDQLIVRLKQADEVALAAAGSTRQLAAAINVLGDGIGVLHEALPGGADDLLNFTDSVALANQAADDAGGPQGKFHALAEVIDAVREAAGPGSVSLDDLAASTANAADEAEHAARSHILLKDALAETETAIRSTDYGTIASALGDLTADFYTAGAAVDWYGTRIDALNGIQSEAQGNANTLQHAYDILNERIAAGIPLTEDQIALYGELPGLIGEYETAADDAALSEAELVAHHQDQRTAADELNGTMGDLTDVLRALVEVLGGDLPTASGKAKDALSDLLNLGAGGSPLASALSGIMGGIGPNAALAAGAARQTGGPNPAVAAGAATQAVAPILIPVHLDASDVGTEAARVQNIAGALVAGEDGKGWTIELLADADDVYAVVRDTEDAVVAVVTPERTIYFEGDATDALSDAQAVERAMDAVDGGTSTVYVYANATPAYNTLAGLLGYQGDAYVNVYAVPQGNYTGVNLASGGTVPSAAMGRVVRAGEIGPELVYPPGGSPYLAARDGLYVMAPGSYVSNAAATSASAGRAGIALTVNVYGSVGVDDIAERLVDLLDQSLAMAFQDRYTAIGWPYGS